MNRVGNPWGPQDRQEHTQRPAPRGEPSSASTLSSAPLPWPRTGVLCSGVAACAPWMGPSPPRDPAVQLWAHALAALHLLWNFWEVRGAAWGGPCSKMAQPPGPSSANQCHCLWPRVVISQWPGRQPLEPSTLSSLRPVMSDRSACLEAHSHSSDLGASARPLTWGVTRGANP